MQGVKCGPTRIAGPVVQRHGDDGVDRPWRALRRLLLRDGQPSNQSWDGRWVYQLQPSGNRTHRKITEHGWTDGFPFFIMQRVLSNPSVFLRLLRRDDGTRGWNDAPEIQVVRSH